MKFELINKALTFAAEKHTGAYRKGTEIPYIVHPMEVGAIAATLSDDENTVAAAILHDTIEDTGTKKEELIKEFNDVVAYLVANESEDKREERPAADTWRERKEETHKHLLECNDERIKIIALADKLSNLRSIHRDLNEKGEDFWKIFNNSNPVDHKWYYSEFLTCLKSLENTQAYKEYANLVEDTFGKY